jgi:hypothetical protein
MDGYQNMCDTNKNVTKMVVIIKEVYYIWLLTLTHTTLVLTLGLSFT